MDIELPLIPAGVLVLLSFFEPYAVALVNHPKWSSGHKKLAAVVVSVVLTVVVLGGYYLIPGDTVTSWPMFILLGLTVSQSAYALVFKNSAKTVEAKHGITE